MGFLGLFVLLNLVLRFIFDRNKLSLFNPFYLMPNIWNTKWKRFNYFNHKTISNRYQIYCMLSIIVFNIWMYIWKNSNSLQYQQNKVHKWNDTMNNFLHYGKEHILANMIIFCSGMICGEMTSGSGIIFWAFWICLLFMDWNNEDKCYIGASGMTWFLTHFIWTTHIFHFWLFDGCQSSADERKKFSVSLLSWIQCIGVCSLILMIVVCTLLGKTSNRCVQVLASSGETLGCIIGLVLLPLFMYGIRSSRNQRIRCLDVVTSGVPSLFGTAMLTCYLKYIERII